MSEPNPFETVGMSHHAPEPSPDTKETSFQSPEEAFIAMVHSIGIESITNKKIDDWISRNKSTFSWDRMPAASEVVVNYPEGFDGPTREAPQQVDDIIATLQDNTTNTNSEQEQLQRFKIESAFRYFIDTLFETR